MSGLVVSKSYNNRHMRISKTDFGESSKSIVLMVLQKKIEKSFFKQTFVSYWFLEIFSFGLIGDCEYS